MVKQGEDIMALYRRAIEADPLCSQAHKNLAEMKLRVRVTHYINMALFSRTPGAPPNPWD